MSKNIEDTLLLLKGFTFDGYTGRTISDLYATVDGIGCTKDTPFAMPFWYQGDEKPVVINSYLEPEGTRVHIIWQSDDSGLSSVIDVVLNAPSLAEEKPEDESCDACTINIMETMRQATEDEMD